MPVKVTFQPLTIKTCPSFEKLYGSKGPCGGCWCMTWRDFEKHKGDANKEACILI